MQASPLSISTCCRSPCSARPEPSPTVAYSIRRYHMNFLFLPCRSRGEWRRSGLAGWLLGLPGLLAGCSVWLPCPVSLQMDDKQESAGSFFCSAWLRIVLSGGCSGAERSGGEARRLFYLFCCDLVVPAVRTSHAPCYSEGCGWTRIMCRLSVARSGHLVLLLLSWG